MDYSSFDIRKYPTLSAKEGYGEWAATYEDSVEDEMDIRLLERIQSINWEKVDSAVDLACGTGRIGYWLKKKGVRSIIGIDLTPEMLKKAAEKEVYDQLITGDILSADIGRNLCDLSVEVLADEHLADLFPLYTQAGRITQAGGHFVIVGYHPHFLMNGLITHFHRSDGEAIAIKSFVHLISDHVKAGLHNGFQLSEMEEGIIDEAWLAKKPKWLKYKNRPVSFMMVWKKMAK